MRIAVLDAMTLGQDIDLSPLERVGELVRYDVTPPDCVASRVGQADAVIVNKVPLGPFNLDAAKRLKLICVAATGYDNIDTAYCLSRGIAVCNVRGYSTDSVAQVTVGMVLTLYTHLAEYQHYVRSGEYAQSGVQNRLQPVYHEVAGKTWGVVGLGNIGKKVAAVAQALGCRVLAFKRTADAEYSCVALDTLCRESDIVTLHLPLSQETRHLINRETISAMKDGAVLINVARGDVTDEIAVADAIESGKLSGFGADVYSQEPFGQNHPFARIMDRPNVLLTPHMAWGAYESRRRVVAEMAENIKAFERGIERNRIV